MSIAMYTQPAVAIGSYTYAVRMATEGEIGLPSHRTQLVET